MSILYSSSAIQSSTVNNLSSYGPFLTTIDSNAKFPRFKIKDHWNLKEKLKFLIFFKNNEEEFKNSAKNAKWNLFKDMAIFIKTRNFNQCRNYFIRIHKQFGGINQWTESMRNENKKFDQQYLDVLQQDEISNNSCLYGQNFKPEYMKNELNNYQSQYNIEIHQQKNINLQDAMRMGQALFANYGQNSNNSSMPMNIFKKYYPSLQERAFRQAQFRQCHRLFIQWCAKVNELVEIQKAEEAHKIKVNKQRFHQ